MRSPRIPSRTSVLIVGALSALGLLQPVFAGEPGNLDDSFSGDGKVMTDVGSDDDSGFDSVLQPDGKLVVGGYATEGGQEDFALVRYRRTGRLDKSFGGDGKVTTDFEGSDDEIYGLALQPDGKIIAAGFASVNGENRLALARYRPNGTLDPNFRGDGKLTADFGAGAIALDVRVLKNRKILVAGGATPAAGEEMALARYRPNGALDSSFGGDGKVTKPFSQGPGRGFDLSVRKGKYVVAGWVTNASNVRIYAIARFHSSGMLDDSFDDDGRVTIKFPGGSSQALAVKALDTGKILVTGSGFSTVSDGSDITLARLKSNGKIDDSFAGDGIAQIDFGGDFDEALAMLVQPDGKIVVGGSGGPVSRFALVRFNQGGSIDASFGTNGKVRTKFPGSAEIWGLSLSSGRLVAAGYADRAPSDDVDFVFAAARYRK